MAEGLKDARSLVRHVLPAMAAGLEFILFAWAFGVIDQDVRDRLKRALEQKDSATVVAGAITLLFASGAAGYAIGSVYHFLLNTARFRYVRVMDYFPVLEKLVDRKDLKVVGLDGKAMEFKKRNYRRDWVIVNTLWHERGETTSRFKSASARAESWSDTAHSAGTLFVGSVIALVAALAIAKKVDLSNWALAAASLLVLIHLISFYQLAKMTSTFIGTVVGDQVCGESEPGKPVVVHYAGE